MEIILQYVRKLYSFDMNNVNIKKGIGRLIIVGVLFPAQMLIWLFGAAGIGYYIYMPLVKYLNAPYNNDGHMTAGDFGFIFTLGVGIFILHVLVYVFYSLVVKIKPHFDMLISLAAVVIIFHNGLVSPYEGSGGVVSIMEGFGFTIAWNYAYALILFAIFCGAIILTKYLHMKKYIFRILISTSISFILGFPISYWIWQIIADHLLTKY